MNNIIRIGCIKYEPYLNFCEDVAQFCLDCHDNAEYGIDYEIVRYSLLGLGNSMKQKYFSLEKFIDIGSPINASKPNGQYDGVIGAMMNNTVDIIIPSLSVLADRSNLIDFIVPAVQFDPDSFLVHPTRFKPTLPSFLNVFSLGTWLLACTTFLLLSVAISFVNQIDSRFLKPSRMIKKSSVFELSSALLLLPGKRTNVGRGMTVYNAMFGILFEKRLKHKWSKAQSMLLITVWSASAILGTRVFSALIVKGLTPLASPSPFETLTELGSLMIQQKYTMIVIESGASFDILQPQSTYEPWAPIRASLPYNTPHYVKDFKAGLNLVKSTPGTLFYVSEIQGSKVSKNTHLLNILEKPGTMSMYSFGIRKKSQLFQRFMTGYLALLEHGFVEMIYRKYGLSTQDHPVVHQRVETTLKQLNLFQTKQAFRILWYGLICSNITFVLEYIIVILNSNQ